MSIANEIQRIQSAKANIKTAIENKGVTVGDGTIDTYAEKIGEISDGSGDYDQGYEDGKNSMPEWDKWVNNCSLLSLNMFKTPEVEINFGRRNITGFVNFLNVSSLEYANTTVEHLTINCPLLATSIQQMFFAGNNDGRDFKLKRLTFNIDIQNATNVMYAFSGLRALEILDGIPLNFSSATNLNNTFNSLYELIEFRVVPNTIKVNLNLQHSSKLSAETIQSIIDGLADLTGGTAQTLTLHATVGGKLTDEQKATITAKNWELVY